MIDRFDRPTFCGGLGQSDWLFLLSYAVSHSEKSRRESSYFFRTCLIFLPGRSRGRFSNCVGKGQAFDPKGARYCRERNQSPYQGRRQGFSAAQTTAGPLVCIGDGRVENQICSVDRIRYGRVGHYWVGRVVYSSRISCPRCVYASFDGSSRTGLRPARVCIRTG